MELSGLKCNGCGSTNVRFEEKSRMLICFQCGREEPFSRRDFANNDKVVIAKDNAIHFFMNGNLNEAHKYAQDVLNIMVDNIPALYIMAYYDEIMNKRAGSIKRFFEQVMDIVDVDYHEVRDMLKLFELTARHLIDYEKEMLTFVGVNMQSNEDCDELRDFTDKLCPYFIGRRSSIDYFKDNYELYLDFAIHCGIPKTCYALMKSITENPDSPYKNNRFDHLERNKHFFDNYVEPIGVVVSKMNYAEMKERFIGYYSKVKDKFKADARI